MVIICSPNSFAMLKLHLLFFFPYNLLLWDSKNTLFHQSTPRSETVIGQDVLENLFMIKW